MAASETKRKRQKQIIQIKTDSEKETKSKIKYIMELKKEIIAHLDGDVKDIDHFGIDELIFILKQLSLLRKAILVQSKIKITRIC